MSGRWQITAPDGRVWSEAEWTALPKEERTRRLPLHGDVLEGRSPPAVFAYVDPAPRPGACRNCMGVHTYNTPCREAGTAGALYGDLTNSAPVRR